MEKISLLTPQGTVGKYQTLSPTTLHDLGLDAIVKSITKKETEQSLIIHVLSGMSKDPRIAKYRIEVFSDIYSHPEMCAQLMEILDRIDFIRDYGYLKKDFDDSATAWDLMHRLEEIKDYIDCVEALYSCLAHEDITSEGLLALRDYVNRLHEEHFFAELKEDIGKIKADTQNIKSITVGINLNNRFEANSIGVVSINNKYFTKSNVIEKFCESIQNKDQIQNGCEWKEKYTYHPFQASAENIAASMEQMSRMKLTMANPVLGIGLAGVARNDTTEDIPRYMDRITNHMLSITVKRLRETLNRYVTITITDITDLIPEFLFYIRMSEFIKIMEEKGYSFCTPVVCNDTDFSMEVKDLYNLRLASSGTCKASEIVPNDLDFSPLHCTYILTGANRGGKTTITQAVGLLFVLAQSGIRVPAASFSFSPVDCIYTHFPADEDKTLDLGRLGEECKRFRELYSQATKDSLLLLNETFSTTSFEEGYFIAKDSLKAILQKGTRTIYNTHMHKLSFDIEELNAASSVSKAASLIVKTQEGKRSFKIEIAPPEGTSYASDIAKKYGVTYDMLMNCGDAEPNRFESESSETVEE